MDCNYIIRHAFDIGSGATKLSACVFDLDKNEIKKIIYSKQYEVLVGNDLKQSKDNRLSEEIMKKLTDTILELYNESLELINNEYKEYQMYEKAIGIVTAAFRISENGREYIENFCNEYKQMDFRVIDQTEEGNIGFLTGSSAIGLDNYFDGISNNNILVYDSGGASFQISSKKINDGDNNNDDDDDDDDDELDLNVFEGNYGSSSSTYSLIVNIKNQDYNAVKSPNPVTNDEFTAFFDLLKTDISSQLIPEDIEKKINEENCKIVAIGGETSMFNMARILLNKTIFSPEEIRNRIDTVLNKTDDELLDLGFNQVEMLIPKLVLMLVVSEIFKFREIYYLITNGSTNGMFIKKDYWIN